MLKLKLNLKSKRPTTVYSSNGKPYRLQPGTNTLLLSPEDYEALAKSLGLNTCVSEKKCDSHVTEAPKCGDPSVDNSNREEVFEDANNEVLEEQAPQDDHVDEQPSFEDNKSPDYASMSYNKLKAAYKELTGKSCKLKKEDVIEFLQEHS